MKQVEADVVIIGAGTAGLPAAVAAAQGGASVIVFEKAATTGGTGNMANGPFAVESKLQRQSAITITREQAFQLHMDYTHWRVDARLVAAFYDKSADTIEWLEELGCEMGQVSTHSLGANPTWHVIKGERIPGQPQGLGALMMKALTDKAQEMGVKFFLRTTTKKILKEGERVVGVLAEDDSGEDVQAKAKAVIITTGGFGDSPEWIKKYTGFEWGRNLYSMRIPGLVGEGIKMAWEAGATSTEMAMELTYGLALALSPERHSIAANAFRQSENLNVNLLGERFMNEDIKGNAAFGANAVALQKGGCCFSIFDGATAKYWEENGFLFGPSQGSFDLDAELKRVFIDGQDKLMDKDVFIVNSLEELASKIGINPDALRKTVDEYNEACEKGWDGLFNKDHKYLRPIKQPKFYAGRIIPGAFGSLGGIKINYKTEVLTKNHDVIPGLYAAGTDANSIYADSYAYPLPGNTMGFAINTGRMAGENALEYTKSIGK